VLGVRLVTSQATRHARATSLSRLDRAADTERDRAAPEESRGGLVNYSDAGDGDAVPGQVTASDNGSGVTRTVVVFGARRGLSAISLIYRIGRAGAMNGRQLIR
jgi:hypothetical protein